MKRFFNRCNGCSKNIMKKTEYGCGRSIRSNFTVQMVFINAVKNALKEAEKVTNGQTTEPDKEKLILPRT